MNVKKEGRFFMRIIMAVIPIAILMGIIILPNFMIHTPIPASLHFTIDKQIEKDGKVSLYGNFKEKLQENETIWLYAENAEITIRIKEDVFHFTTNTLTPAMFYSPGSGWFSFQTPAINELETVEITVRSYHGDHNYAVEQVLTNINVGDGSGLYHKALASIDFFGIILIFAMIAGIIFLAEGGIDYAMGMSKEGSRIAILSFYCFTGALRCSTDVLYPYLSLFLSPAWIVGLVDMAGVLLFPIALSLMILYYTRGNITRKIMRCILLFETLTAIVCILCQFIGFADLKELQFISSSIGLVTIGMGVFCIAFELKHYRDTYLVLLLLTVLPVFICMTADGINILYPFMPRRTLMQYGFAISALLLILQLVSYAKAQVVKAEHMKRLEVELEDSRIKIMLSQIQPHFLYNSLSGIKQLTDSDPAKASKALEHFSYYLRRNLDSLVHKEVIPFEREMEHVEDYLYLENMRFPNKINIARNLMFTDFSLPPLAVQTIVENAIRYGITKKKGGGALTIRCEQIGKDAVITVHDDGIGFNTTIHKDDGRTHTGIENVRNRLRLQCHATLMVESEEDVGTTVTITIPLKENHK